MPPAKGDTKVTSAWICGIGMATAVGDCAAQTATSVRAGICRYALSQVHNRQFRPMKLALLPEAALPPIDEPPVGFTSRQVRLLRLCKLALPEALAALPEGRKAPLFLAGPEAMADRPSATTQALLDQVAALGGDKIDAKKSMLFASGRAAGLQALGAAIESLAKGTSPYALVGGVDSFLDLWLLGTLDLEGRVLAEGVMDGFAPGEGAGFLLLATDATQKSAHPDARVRVHAPGLADEPGHRYSKEPYRGDGLANAVAAALQGGKGPYPTVLSTLNGENFGAKEWGTATIRNAGELGTVWSMHHPAEYFGDVGAAFGPVLIGLAAIGMAKGHLPGPCLVYCSSEHAPRGAVRVTLSS